MSKSPTSIQLCPLHVHSQYSVLDGASSLDDFINWAKQNGATTVGVTDHGFQIGLLELYTKAKKAGLNAAPGCEFYVAPPSDWKFNKKPYDYFHVTVWCSSEIGYRNLMKLGSKSFAQDEINGKKRVVSKFGQVKPRITFDELFEHNEGLVIGSGCLIGAVNKALLQGETTGAELNLLRLLEVFKGRMFIEILPHNCTHDWDRKGKKFVENRPSNECADFSHDGDLQKAANLKNIEYARKYDIPLLMTTDAHMVKPSQKAIQDILLQNGDPDGWRFYTTYDCLTTDQAWTHWVENYGNDIEQRKIFTEAIENNNVLGEMCKDLTIKDKYHQPEPKIDQEILEITSNEGDAIRLQILKQIDFHGRMKNDPIWQERLDRELNTILDNPTMSFGRYFLFLEQWCRTMRGYSSISAPGRGSAAGCLVAYLLKITHLDPIKYNLPFERFLSNARIQRGKFPDIDWDQGSKGRDLMIALMKQEYGDKIAQCSTLGTLKVKGALKDVCRILLGWNSADPRINEITKTIPNTPQGVPDGKWLTGYQDQDGIIHDGHILQNPVLDAFFKAHPEVYDAVMGVLNTPRSIGSHASAYLISDESIFNSVPTMQFKDGTLLTQYNAAASFNSVEKAGLVKFDFLSVRVLDTVSQTIRLVQQQAGYKVWDEEIKVGNETFTVTRGELPIEMIPTPDGRLTDIYELPEIAGVFQMISEGKTESLFQINTPIMTPACRQVKPHSIMCLSDLVAGIRPGPLEAIIEDGKTTMWGAYVKRRAGKMATTYAHPDMEPILRGSYGVALYQEDLQLMFQDLAGYSATEADELREILAKKQKEKVQQRIPELRQRLKDKGWTDAQAQVFVNLCIASSAYSFNRAHSASYAMVAYITAYLRYHFPTPYWCSVLSCEKLEDIKEQNYAKTIKDLLLLPSVNGSLHKFEMIDDKVHAPLIIISGVGPAAVEGISRARRDSGPFISFQDFFERVNRSAVDQSVMHNLILCESFASIEPDKSPNELMEEYHYLKRVTALKVGKGKTGEDLFNAVIEYRIKEMEKGQKLDIPEECFRDRLQTEVARLSALPIYRINVHEDFKDLLAAKGVLYDEHKATLRVQGSAIRVYKNVPELTGNIDGQKGTIGVFAGMIQESDTFQFSKDGSKVTALKMTITNDGDSIEAVLWPEQYAELGAPKTDRIVFVIGKIKEARDPGKWSMSVNQLRYV